MSAQVALLPRPSALPSPADPVAAERRALAGAIGSLRAAVAELEAVQQPITRLQEAIRAADEADTQLAACRRDDDARLAAWLASGASGLRPQPAEATLAAEFDVAINTQNAAAARSAMPALEERYRAAIARVHERQAARDQSVIALAVAIAKQRTVALAARIRDMLAEQATIVSVADALVSAFRDVARPAAVDIRAAVDRTLRDVGVAHRPEPGRRLLERLMTDPAADFETGDPE